MYIPTNSDPTRFANSSPGPRNQLFTNPTTCDLIILVTVFSSGIILFLLIRWLEKCIAPSDDADPHPSHYQDQHEQEPPPYSEEPQPQPQPEPEPLVLPLESDAKYIDIYSGAEYRIYRLGEYWVYHIDGPRLYSVDGYACFPLPPPQHV